MSPAREIRNISLRISHQPRLSGHEFLISWYKICYYTFHLSEFAKQIILRNISLLLRPSPSSGARVCSAHDENIKKIARKIQIHNAKRSVLLDKTFCEKKTKFGEMWVGWGGMCTIFIIYHTLVFILFMLPSPPLSLSFFLHSSARRCSHPLPATASYMITFYYYCCRVPIHNF